MEQIPIAGVDVSKAFSDMCILSPDNKIFARAKIYHDKVSMDRAVSILEKAEAAFRNKPSIIMEATSHYHLILFQFLSRAGYDVVVINPIQSGALRNLNIRKIKNDKVDAHKIALLYRLKEFKVCAFPSGILFDLRNYCRQYADLSSDHTSYVNRLVGILDQSFPGYRALFSKMASKTALDILDAYPSPAALLAASTEELYMIVAKHTRRSDAFRFAKVEKIQNCAKNALVIGIQMESHSIMIRSLISVIRSLQESMAALWKSIKALIASNEAVQNNVNLLRSIPGIGEYISAVLLSEIGDITNFKSAKQLVAYFGLDPSQRQSGKFIGTKNKISKRGSPYLRWVVALAVNASIHISRGGKICNPILLEYYEKKRESKPSKVALCACMHKIVQYIYAVLRDQKPFELRTPKAHNEQITHHARKIAS